LENMRSGCHDASNTSTTISRASCTLTVWAHPHLRDIMRRTGTAPSIEEERMKDQEGRFRSLKRHKRETEREIEDNELQLIIPPLRLLRVAVAVEDN
jgi:hypothetical protein